MNTFSNKLKKTVSGPFWVHFPNFWGKKISQKIRLCHAQLHMGFYHHAKIQKKLMIQFKENARIDGRMDGRREGWKDGKTDRPYLQDPSGYGWVKNTLYIILKLEDSTARKKKQLKKSGNSEKTTKYKITDKEGLQPNFKRTSIYNFL